LVGLQINNLDEFIGFTRFFSIGGEMSQRKVKKSFARSARRD